MSPDAPLRRAARGGVSMLKIDRLKIVGLAAAMAFLGAAPALAQAGGASLHGFADLSLKNDYITPRGLHVTSDGATIQFLNGLVLDFPQDPAGVVTDVSVSA